MVRLIRREGGVLNGDGTMVEDSNDGGNVGDSSYDHQEVVDGETMGAGVVIERWGMG